MTAPSDLVLRRPDNRAAPKNAAGQLPPHREHPARPHQQSEVSDAPAIQPHHHPERGGQPPGRGPGAHLAHHPHPPPRRPGSGAGGRLRGRGQAAEPGPLRPHRWQVHGADRHEVLVGGEGLQRGPVDVLGTLLHEAAHGLAQTRGLQDTSRQGRYHNRRYATLAGELGLEVASVQPIGWSATTVPDTTTAAAYAGQLEDLATALVLWRRHEHCLGPGGRSRNLLAASCGCGRRIRVAKTTLVEAPILCGACEQQFQPADPDDQGL